jgi:Rrf2 family transcriptional regulator, iron-sulfur cluster assembly transcription factor
MLSQSVGYAATALGCVAAMGGKPVLIRHIAKMCAVPAPYLAKLINLLARRRIVLTQRGHGGGVSLARPAAEVTLMDLCVALDDPALTPRCLLGGARCSEDRACPAHAFCRACRRQQTEFLQRTTIADIAAFEARRRWDVAAPPPPATAAPARRRTRPAAAPKPKAVPDARRSSGRRPR